MKSVLAIAVMLSLSSFSSMSFAADPVTAHDFAEAAFNSAKASDADKAFSQIHAAAKLSSTDIYVIDIAAKLAAWYDTRVYKSQFSDQARKDIEATMVLLLARPQFNTTYKTAAQYYGDLASAQLPQRFAPEIAAPEPEPRRVEIPIAETAPQPAPAPVYQDPVIFYGVGGIPLVPYNTFPRSRATIINNSPTSIPVDPIFIHSGTPIPNYISTPRNPTIINNSPTSVPVDPIFRHSGSGPIIYSPAPPSRPVVQPLRTGGTNMNNNPTSIRVDAKFQHSK